MNKKRSGLIQLYSLLLLLTFAVKICGNVKALYTPDVATILADISASANTTDTEKDHVAKETTEFNGSLTAIYVQPHYSCISVAIPNHTSAGLLTGHSTVIIQPPRKALLSQRKITPLYTKL